MKFLDKIFSKIIGSEMSEYLEVVNDPDNTGIDKIKEVIKKMENRYKSDIESVLKTHHAEIQKLYVILGKKLEQKGLTQEAINSYKEAIKLDGHPALTKDAKEKTEFLEGKNN